MYEWSNLFYLNIKRYNALFIVCKLFLFFCLHNTEIDCRHAQLGKFSHPFHAVRYIGNVVIRFKKFDTALLPEPFPLFKICFFFRISVLHFQRTRAMEIEQFSALHTYLFIHSFSVQIGSSQLIRGNRQPVRSIVRLKGTKCRLIPEIKS